MSEKKLYISKESENGKIIDNLTNLTKDIKSLSKYDNEIEHFYNNSNIHLIIIIIFIIICYYFIKK